MYINKKKDEVVLSARMCMRARIRWLGKCIERRCLTRCFDIDRDIFDSIYASYFSLKKLFLFVLTEQKNSRTSPIFHFCR